MQKLTIWSVINNADFKKKCSACWFLELLKTYFALFAHAEEIVSRLLVTPVMEKSKVMHVK